MSNTVKELDCKVVFLVERGIPEDEAIDYVKRVKPLYSVMQDLDAACFSVDKIMEICSTNNYFFEYDVKGYINENGEADAEKVTQIFLSYENLPKERFVQQFIDKKALGEHIKSIATCFESKFHCCYIVFNKQEKYGVFE